MELAALRQGMWMSPLRSAGHFDEKVEDTGDQSWRLEHATNVHN
jgi:hypothetical protein